MVKVCTPPRTPAVHVEWRRGELSWHEVPPGRFLARAHSGLRRSLGFMHTQNSVQSQRQCFCFWRTDFQKRECGGSPEALLAGPSTAGLSCVPRSMAPSAGASAALNAAWSQLIFCVPRARDVDFLAHKSQFLKLETKGSDPVTLGVLGLRCWAHLAPCTVFVPTPPTLPARVFAAI